MNYITAAQIAATRGLSLRTVHRLIDSGELPHVTKLPGKTGAYLFEPAVVERAFAARDKTKIHEPAA